MALENKNVLKSYYLTGEKPSESQWQSFIDSMTNIIDNGAVSQVRLSEVVDNSVTVSAITQLSSTYSFGVGFFVGNTRTIRFSGWFDVELITRTATIYVVVGNGSFSKQFLNNQSFVQKIFMEGYIISTGSGTFVVSITFWGTSGDADVSSWCIGVINNSGTANSFPAPTMYISGSAGGSGGFLQLNQWRIWY